MLSGTYIRNSDNAIFLVFLIFKIVLLFVVINLYSNSFVDSVSCSPYSKKKCLILFKYVLRSYFLISDLF